MPASLRSLLFFSSKFEHEFFNLQFDGCWPEPGLRFEATSVPDSTRRRRFSSRRRSASTTDDRREVFGTRNRSEHRCSEHKQDRNFFGTRCRRPTSTARRRTGPNDFPTAHSGDLPSE